MLGTNVLFVPGLDLIIYSSYSVYRLGGLWSSLSLNGAVLLSAGLMSNSKELYPTSRALCNRLTAPDR